MSQPAPPLNKQFLALDKEVAMKYVTWLVEKRIADGDETRGRFCEESGFHPKLLYDNPHLGAIEKLFQDQSTLERLGDLSLRDYLKYYRRFVQEAHDHAGAQKLQLRWLGQDVDLTPWDAWIYQEIIWETRPSCVISVGGAGIAHFSASVLDLMGEGAVLLVDAQPLVMDSSRIVCIDGMAVSPEVIGEIRRRSAGRRTLVILAADAQGEQAHAQIEAYAPFVHIGGYMVTAAAAAADRFLREHTGFVRDRRFAERLVLGLTPNGFLLRLV